MPSPRASDDVRRPHIRIYCQNTSRTEARLAEHSRSRDARRRATDAVADKARTAAIIDAYANQAARVGALLPFTSALAGLCAAAAAAAVEVAPIAAAVFPVLGAVCAAAASVSKACCEADASAAAASTEQLSSADADDAPGVYRALLATARDALRGRPGDLG
mmetsp:Transcript_25252/g.77856  ORF Transcript_25252/g.77856 Transcript_25252/m.77856 type:complete len:162 (+) Transcript_25252:334-819(+)